MRIHLVVLCTVLSIQCAAQEQQTCTVSVPVTVATSTGEPDFRRLTAQDLRVRIGSREISPHVAKQRSGRVVLLLDHSGSMDERLPLAVRITQEIVAAIPENIPIALYSFEERVQFAPTRQQVPMLLEKLVQDAPQPRKTRFFSAVARALSELSLSPGDLLVAITDGGDTASKESAETILKKLNQAAVRLSAVAFAFPTPSSAVGFTIPTPSSPEELYGLITLRELVSKSSGIMTIVDPNLKAPPTGAMLLPKEFLPDGLEFNLVELKSFPSERNSRLRINWAKKPHPRLELLAPSRLPDCIAQ